jgi:hypothetical protein
MNDKKAHTPIVCDDCGREIQPFTRTHNCDGGEALRKAARELFEPTAELIEKLLVKSGTGILSGVFDIVYERDRLKVENSAISAQCEALRAALEKLEDKLPKMYPDLPVQLLADIRAALSMGKLNTQGEQK